jgi:hypothetical protein
METTPVNDPSAVGREGFQNAIYSMMHIMEAFNADNEEKAIDAIRELMNEWEALESSDRVEKAVAMIMAFGTILEGVLEAMGITNLEDKYAWAQRVALTTQIPDEPTS